MKIQTFIDRPILAGVISVFITLLGIICLVQLPVEQFPEIAPPTVLVSATYPGANAETVQKSVVVPLEEAINGVENMMYMVSSATNTGSATIQIYFRQGTDGDMAMVNVQNRLASAQGQLPAEVTKSGLTVRKRRIAGVGEVDVKGADYSLRIWLDPGKMAQYGLVPSDIRKVLDEQNLESPTGTLGAESEHTFRYVLKYRGRYDKETDYENLVVSAQENGTVLRLKDVARVELGSKTYEYIGSMNGHPGTTCMISQTSGSNANEIIEEIDKVVAEISENLPKGMAIADLMSTKDFLDASIRNVVKTLIEAVLLVVLVVYVFLQNIRSTLIPTVSIIVSLIGTFAFLYVAGFSLNMITLFALVLVIDTVVDDAIVVVEAVQAKFDEGYRSPYEATIRAMDGISSALLTSTFVFMAVFIPVSFMGGTTGTFYMQFGLTMAVAVGISLLNALTLSPALCALLMTPHTEVTAGERPGFSTRSHLAFNAAFNRMLVRYKSGVLFLFRRKWLAGLSLLLACGGLVYLMQTTKTGLVPNEDMGTINIDVQTPPGTNLQQTARIMEEIDRKIGDIPQIKVCAKTTGMGMLSGMGSSSGMFTIRLHPWDERTEKGDDIQSVIDEIYRRTADITAASHDSRLWCEQRFRDSFAGPEGRQHRGFAESGQSVDRGAERAAGDSQGYHRIRYEISPISVGGRCRTV